MANATFRIWRGEQGAGQYRDYTIEILEGMVVLDAIHEIQASQAFDLAVRWNCKAGKCGSCSAEINGSPKCASERAAGNGRADEGVSARAGPRHRCFLELSGEKEDQEIQAAASRC